MPISRVVDERVLVPISEQKPAGEDLRGLKDWVEIRKARPSSNDIGSRQDWEPASPVKTDWATYKAVVQQALCRKSKDLELGVFLTEACSRVHGFAGVRDGIWTLKGLLTGFADRGLYPLPEDGSLEGRYGKLEWLNEKLAEVAARNPAARIAIFHGTRDQVIPVRMGRELAREFRFVEFFAIEDADHVSVLNHAHDKIIDWMNR